MNKKFVLAIALAMLLSLLVVASVSAGAIVTRSETEVVQNGLWTDEYVDEEGVYHDNCPDVDIEDILVQGSYTIKTTSVSDGNGGVHTRFHFNWAGITGTGLTTGDTYVVPQVISSRDYFHQFEEGEGPANGTGTLTFQLISKGSGENVRVKGVWHFTTNANGELTIDKDTFISIVCK